MLLASCSCLPAVLHELQHTGEGEAPCGMLVLLLHPHPSQPLHTPVLSCPALLCAG